MMTSKKTETSPTLDEIRQAIAVIEDKKCESIRVLDVRGKSSITDYLIIVTGTSNPHIKAMKIALDEFLKSAGIKLLGVNREDGSGWIVLDAFNYMIHLQTEEMRDFYRLEHLWKDAEIVEIQ
ncbi:MAG: ribosome-associated protein [Lentimonas sp.]|jgi:ribosome-associated protein